MPILLSICKIELEEVSGHERDQHQTRGQPVAGGIRYELDSSATEAFGANSDDVGKYFRTTAAFGVNSEELGQYFQATEPFAANSDVNKELSNQALHRVRKKSTPRKGIVYSPGARESNTRRCARWHSFLKTSPGNIQRPVLLNRLSHGTLDCKRRRTVA